MSQRPFLHVLRSLARLVTVASLAWLVLACGEADHPTKGRALEGKLVLTGSSTVAPLAAEIARRFEERHPQARIDVQTGGSSRGIADARSGVADIGMASRSLKEEESDLRAITIAQDGITLVVHADNPVAALDDRQVVAIYTGEIDDWAALGGEPGTITVVNKAAGRATLEVFLEHFALDAGSVEADVIIGDNQQGIKTVVGNPGAIAYLSIGAADYEARQGAPIKLLDAGSMAPTPENVASGRFPMTRPLNFVVREAATGELSTGTGGDDSLSDLARAFLDFASSSEVHDLIAAQFFVPAAPSEHHVPAGTVETSHPDGEPSNGDAPQS